MSEQSDPGKIFKKSSHRSLPSEQYLLGVLIEIALHGPNAFREVASSADARGWTQFTNRPVINKDKNWPGTYNHTYRTCRTAAGQPVIVPDFATGTSDPVNLIKAAFCYLDFELSELPEAAKERYRKNPRLGSMPVLVAYNAGGGLSRWIHLRLQKLKDVTKLTHDSLPQELFTGSKFHDQPYYYVRKYWWSLKALDELR